MLNGDNRLVTHKLTYPFIPLSQFLLAEYGIFQMSYHIICSYQSEKEFTNKVVHTIYWGLYTST
jgi:hypothetical protein